MEVGKWAIQTARGNGFFFFFPQTIRTSLYLRFRNQEEGMGSSVTSPCEMVLHVKWV